MGTGGDKSAAGCGREWSWGCRSPRARGRGQQRKEWREQRCAQFLLSRCPSGCCCCASPRLVHQAGERRQWGRAALVTNPRGMPQPGEEQKQHPPCVRHRVSYVAAAPSPSRDRAGVPQWGQELRAARPRHSPTPALPASSVLVWAGGEGRMPGSRLSAWQSARRAAPSVGSQVRSWKGLELSPMWGTTGAGEAAFPSLLCQEGLRQHGEGFSPFASFCSAQDKCLGHKSTQRPSLGKEMVCV